MSSPTDGAPMKRIKSEDSESGKQSKPVTEWQGKGEDEEEEEEEEEEKVSSSKYNPYLAHMDEYNVKKEGYSSGHPKGSAFHNFTRRQTTAKQAFDAEGRDNNPFTGEPHSQQYFSILKVRRSLPVHKQR